MVPSPWSGSTAHATEQVSTACSRYTSYSRHKRASGACRLSASALIGAVVRARHRRWSQGRDERRRPPHGALLLSPTARRGGLSALRLLRLPRLLRPRYAFATHSAISPRPVGRLDRADNAQAGRGEAAEGRRAAAFLRPETPGSPPGRRKMRAERDSCRGGCSAEHRAVSVATLVASGGVGDPVVVVGWPGALQPPAPTDPGVTVSRHRALLTGRSARANPSPVREQVGRSIEHPSPPALEARKGS